MSCRDPAGDRVEPSSARPSVGQPEHRRDVTRAPSAGPDATLVYAAISVAACTGDFCTRTQAAKYRARYSSKPMLVGRLDTRLRVQRLVRLGGELVLPRLVRREAAPGSRTCASSTCAARNGRTIPRSCASRAACAPPASATRRAPSPPATRAQRCTGAARRPRPAARTRRASNRRSRTPSRATDTSRPSRRSSRPGRRPSRATIAWLPSSSSCSDVSIGGLSRSTQYAANASRKRSLFWLTPTGSNALTSSERISTYCTPPRRSAFVGRSPDMRHALRADEAVVLVLDLQHVGVQLAVLAVDLHADLFVVGIRRADRLRQVAHVVVEAVDRDLEPRLALVAVAEVAHAQRRGVRRVEAAGHERPRASRPCGPAGTTGRSPASCRTGTGRSSRGDGNCAAARSSCRSGRPARRRGSRSRSASTGQKCSGNE